MEKRRSFGALVVPVVMLVFACVYGWANRSVPAGDMRFATPLTIGLGLLSLLLIAQILIGRAQVGPTLTFERMTRPVLLLLCTGLLLLLTGWDFPIAVGLFLALAIPLMGYRRWIMILPVVVVMPLLLFWGFTSLGVPLTSFWMEF